MIKSKTEEEINQLAKDIFAGQVYTDRHLKRLQDIHLVFIPLVFWDQDTVEAMKKDPPGLFYEYLSQAGGRSVNGQPTFMSVQLLNVADTKRVSDKLKAIDSAMKTALGEDNEPGTDDSSKGKLAPV